MFIMQRLKELAKCRGNDVAITSKSYSLTYKEVDEITDKVACEIYESTKGNKKVLLDIDHSISTIISIIAILKSDNTFVPIGKTNSTKSKNEILESCECSLVVTDKESQYNNFRSKYFINDALLKEIKEKDQKIKCDIEHNNERAYILHTSGSTGNPKGVAVSKKNLKYILNNMQTICPVNKNSVYCFSTPYTFDVSITEILGWIIGGGKVVVVDFYETDNFKKFPEIINKYKITHFAVSPSVLSTIFNMMSEEGFKLINYTLKYIMVAGEKFTLDIAEIWEKKNMKAKLYNLYGPTEATVYATYYEIQKNNKLKEIPIGKPLEGVKYEIKKENGEGEIGELVLGGEGITLGYITQNDGFYIEKGERWYATGDIVYEKNNEIFYVGRKDQQVQIHGIRVELGDIETNINLDETVTNNIIIYENNKLVCFIQPIDLERFSLTILKDKLLKRLPKYMIPNIFYVIEKFPLTENNKIDKKQLINNYKSEFNDKNTIEKEELSDLRKDIINIMLRTLNIKDKEKCCLSYDFFKLGGDSLSSIEALVKMENKYKINIDISIFYNSKDILELSFNIEKLIKNNSNESSKVTSNLSCSVCKKIVDKIKIDLKPKNSLNIEKKYNTHYVQRSYYFKKYDSTLSFYQFVNDDVSEIKLNNILNEVILKNPLLKSSLEYKESKNILKFIEYSNEDNWKAPIIDVEDELLLIEYAKWYEEIIKELLKKAKYENGFLSNFIILKAKNKLLVCCGMDHSIADASCIKIIRKDLARGCLGKKIIKKGISYEDFCKLIKKKNTYPKIMANKYTKYIKKYVKNNNSELKKKLIDKPDHIVVKNIESSDPESISICSSYILSKYLCEFLNINNIISGPIMNIRNFKGCSLVDTLGDVHSRVVFVYNKSENKEQFINRAKDIIENVYKREVFSPGYGAFSKFPLMTDENKIIHKIYWESIFISMSYIGVVSDNELDEMINKVDDINSSLKNVSKSQVFTTLVVNNNSLHIFTSDTFIKEKIINFQDLL